MSFVIFNAETKQTHNDKLGYEKIFDTERGAKISCSRFYKNESKYWQVMSYEEYLVWKKLNTKKIKVRSLMTGAEVEIDEDTPWCCNPASETFWSM